MKQIEVRTRVVEALASMGIREPSRLIRDAKEIEEWIMAADNAEETAPARRGRPPKNEDKA